MSDAEKCRARGWTVGTFLEGDEGYGPEVIQITAIGEEKILAKRVDGYEGLWSLDYRDWKAVK